MQRGCHKKGGPTLRPEGMHKRGSAGTLREGLRVQLQLDACFAVGPLVSLKALEGGSDWSTRERPLCSNFREIPRRGV